MILDTGLTTLLANQWHFSLFNFFFLISWLPCYSFISRGTGRGGGEEREKAREEGKERWSWKKKFLWIYDLKLTILRERISTETSDPLTRLKINKNLWSLVNRIIMLRQQSLEPNLIFFFFFGVQKQSLWSGLPVKFITGKKNPGFVNFFFFFLLPQIRVLLYYKFLFLLCFAFCSCCCSCCCCCCFVLKSVSVHR